MLVCLNTNVTNAHVVLWQFFASSLVENLSH